MPAATHSMQSARNAQLRERAVAKYGPRIEQGWTIGPAFTFDDPKTRAKLEAELNTLRPYRTFGNTSHPSYVRYHEIARQLEGRITCQQHSLRGPDNCILWLTDSEHKHLSEAFPQAVRRQQGAQS